MHRRQFLTAAAAAAAAVPFAAAPRRAWAQTDLSLGEARLTALSDGNLSLPADFMFGPMPQDKLAEALAPHGLAPDAPLTPPCNVALWRDEDRVALFDAGSGSTWQPSAGELVDALDAAGLSPGDVTHVIFTHGHPDHLWGVLDDFDDPLFANATHMMGKAEWEYWTDPNTLSSIGADRQALAAGASRRLEIIEDATEFFEDGQEILPGIAARLTPGHTPGHMSFELRKGGASAMVIGDAIGNSHLGITRPGWPSGADQDRDLGIETRLKLLDQIAHAQMPVLGFHFDGAIGRIEPSGDAYRFTPEV